MALPKLVSPTYELTLESTGQTLNYRPFLVKEEKILLMAMESNEERDMVNATKQIINNCVTEDIDVDQLPMFDMEYIFLNLRAKSVGEQSEIGFACPECETVNQFVHMLLKYCKMHKKERVTQKIMAKNLSTLADWNIFINNYIEAHNLALEK